MYYQVEKNERVGMRAKIHFNAKLILFKKAKSVWPHLMKRYCSCYLKVSIPLQPTQKYMIKIMLMIGKDNLYACLICKLRCKL